MDLAVQQAEKALELKEVPVGCVFIHDNKVLGYGHNDTNRTLNGTRHAELCAIDRILETFGSEILHETDLYVTVEPCIMCASALRQVGIRKVFFGAGNDRFGGCGSVVSINQDSQDQSHGTPYPVYPGLRRREAIMLLREFYTMQNPTAPQPKAKKQRIVKEDIPAINFSLYLSETDFANYYGKELLSEYENKESIASF